MSSHEPHKPILCLTAPRVNQVERQDPTRITLGDKACCRLEPGIFALLMNPMGGSAFPVGKDLHPMSTVPAGIAIDAAVEACGGDVTGFSTLRATSFSLEAPVSCREPLIATGEVTRIGDRSVTVAVRVVEEGSQRLILQGEAVMVRVVGGQAGPIPSEV